MWFMKEASEGMNCARYFPAAGVPKWYAASNFSSSFSTSEMACSRDVMVEMQNSGCVSFGGSEESDVSSRMAPASPRVIVVRDQDLLVVR